MSTILALFAGAGFSQPLALNTTSDSVSTERMSMEVNIPKAVKDAFAKQFPNAANPSWSVFPTNGNTNEWYNDSFMTDANSRSEEGTWNEKDTSSTGQGTWNDDSNSSSNREANSPYSKGGNASTGQEVNSTYGNTSPNQEVNTSDDQVGNSSSNKEGYSSTSQEGNSSSIQGGNSTFGKDSSSTQGTTSTYGNEGKPSSNQGSDSDMGGKSTTNQEGNSSTRVANTNSGTDNYYVAEFTSYKTEFKSVFKADGEKVATLNVSTKEVPTAISTALAKGTYKTWEMGDEITEIVKDQQSSDDMKVYKMEAKNDSETHALYFQADGKLLKDEIVD